MTDKHDIIIDNFKPEETVHYSIIIIKGHVTNKCQTEEIYVNSHFFKIIYGKFKVLVELKQGRNVIDLKCCVSVTLPINYKPRESTFTVLPLYIICDGHDGHFQAPDNERNDTLSACKRISLGAKLLQSVFAEKLHEENQGRKTFKLENDCKVFYSKLNYAEARKMSQENLWVNLGREIANSEIARPDLKFLAFLSCTRYCGESYQENFLHEDLVKMTQAYVALGGGGLALFGTACLFTWPENLSQVIKNLENDSMIDRHKFMDDSCYRGTFGACFSTTLGSVLHELCHTFDLGHTESGIMGRGFDDIYKVFTRFQDNEKNVDIKCKFQNNIEFDEKLELGLVLDKEKTYTIKESKRDKDGTFWTKSCLIFLAYHKWFNDFNGSDTKIIKFDPVMKLITSTAGLRVIEIRRESDEMVLKNWLFPSKVLKYSFQIPENELRQLKVSPVMLVVEDNIGNILKHIVNI